MIYKVIKTGSLGNAVVINEVILIDCGVPFKALRDVYKNIKLVLLTHEHTDHFNKQTIKRLASERSTLRFAACEWLINDIVNCGVAKENIDVLSIGNIYNYGLFKVSPVKLKHNAPNCGFRLFFDNEKAFYATDTGTLDGIQAKNYDFYFVEANHTEQELQDRIAEKAENGGYIYELDVAENHLSKEKADNWIYQNISENGVYVYLHGHINKNERKEQKNG
jgi:phosphoribosyl 1,2-cyclic phosphodiesterase